MPKTLKKADLVLRVLLKIIVLASNEGIDYIYTHVHEFHLLGCVVFVVFLGKPCATAMGIKKIVILCCMYTSRPYSVSV